MLTAVSWASLTPFPRVLVRPPGMPLVTAITISYASRTRWVLHTYTKVSLHPTIVGTMSTIVVTLWPHHRVGHGCRLHLAIARSLCYMIVPCVFFVCASVSGHLQTTTY